MSGAVRQSFKRVPVQPPVQQQSQPYSFPAPTRGWIANENEALSGPLGAKILENFFPTQRSIRARGGAPRYATIGTGPVQSMFSYIALSGPNKFFAASTTSIFDITSVADPLVAPAPVLTGQSNGYYSAAHMATVGGNFLYITNGFDAPRLYDGTTWTAITNVSTPAITGLPVSTSALSHVWTYRNRLFFIQTGSMNAWALPVDSIGGAAIQVSLAGVLTKGGSLLTGGTWSQDAGNGINDRCVIISTQGEAVVFEGGDPSNSADWHMVGRYDITPIMGKRGLLSIGGDLLLLTEDGIVPISAAIQKDPAALSLDAVTRPIEPEWQKEVLARNANPWEIIKFPRYNMGVVSLPVTGSLKPYCFVVNLETGAWAKYTGWDTRCLVMHNEWGYFGTSDGKIMKMEVGGNDDGQLYYCTYVGLFDWMGGPATKTILMARTTCTAGYPFDARVSVSTNYTITLPTPPSSPSMAVPPSAWDIGLWDQAVWDATTPRPVVSSKWKSIGRTGYVIAPQVQMTFGYNVTPDVELIAVDLLFESGELVV